jgi:hypothetical protein
VTFESSRPKPAHLILDVTGYFRQRDRLTNPQRPLALAVAVAALVLSGTTAVASFIPQWQQTWSSSGISSSGDPLVARELSDGSRLVVTSTAVAVRYDANGGVLSQVALAPPFFIPFQVQNGNVTLLPSVVTVDPAGVIFVASTSDLSGSATIGDVWLTAYDAATGAALWPSPAVFDGTIHKRDRPTQVIVGPDGNPILIGTQGNGVFAAKFDRTNGARIWGPFVGARGGSPRADVTPAGDVVIGFNFAGLPSSPSQIAIFRLSGTDGSEIGSPILRGTGVTFSDDYTLRGLRADGNGDIVLDESKSSTREILKLSGSSGSVLWGPIAEPDSTASFIGIEITPAGNVVLGTQGNLVLSLTEYVGTGGVLWGPISLPIDSVSNSTPHTRFVVAPDSSILAAAWGNSSGSYQLETFKVSTAGSPVWGPKIGPGTYGGDLRPVLAATSQGGAVEAVSVSAGMQAIELDSATGNPLWGPNGFVATIPVYGRIWDSTQAPDGSVYVLGQATFPTTGTQWVTIKYDRATGAVLWGPKYYSSFQTPYSVRTDASGNAFVAGYDTNSPGTAIIKYAAADGSVLWSTILPSGGDVRGLAVDANGDVGVLDVDAKLTKLAGSNGATLWGPVGGTGAFGDFLAVTASGDFIACDNRPGGSVSHWGTTKYSGSTGSVIWGPLLMGSASLSGDFVEDAVTDPAGGVIVTGDALDVNGSHMTTIRYAANGTVAWGPVTVSGAQSGVAYAVALDSSGDVFVTGEDSGGFATLKYRGSDGAVLWGPTYFTAPSGRPSSARALALDGGGNPIVAGTAYNESWAKDIVLVAYDGATGAQNGAPATIDGPRSHDLPIHDLVVKGTSAVVAGSAQSFLTAAFDITGGIVCDPNDPIPVASANPAPACEGETVTLTASGYPGATYSWTGPNGFSSSLQSPTFPATPAAAGTYSVAIQAYGCSLPGASVYVSVGHAISSAITVSLANGTASVPDAGPGALYVWSLTNANLTSSNGGRSITFTYSASTPQVSFLVTISNAAGCSETGTLTVPVQGFFTVAPCRLVDTRLSGFTPLSANTSRTFSVAAQCGIPPEATAIAVVPVAVAPGASGDLRLYPAGAPLPLTSALNFDAGRTRASNAIIGIVGSQISVQCDMAPGSTATTDFVLDVYGYFR